MNVMEQLLRRLLPKGLPWALAGDGDPLIRGLAKTLDRVRLAARALIAESMPISAVETLPEWCRVLGIAYDSTVPVTTLQARLDAMLCAEADITLQGLQAQIQKEFPSITLAEVSTNAECGVAECGVAVCGGVEGDYHNRYYDIVGTLDSDADLMRLACILARYAPLHLTPCSEGLTILSLVVSSECGAALCGLSVCAGYEGVYVAPSFTVAPTIHGVPVPGQTLICMPGAVVGGPTPTLTYQWRVDAGDISGETGRTYTLPTVPGTSYTCRVTATNDAGSANQESAALTVVPVAPGIVSVAIGGTGGATPTLSVTSIVTSYYYPLGTTTYQWYKDGAVISGETGQSTVIASVEGAEYYCKVTVTNSAGSASRDSNTLKTPEFTSGPTATFSSSSLYCNCHADAVPTATIAYQWYKDGSIISGAIGSTYGYGWTTGSFYCAVTLSNSAGTITTNSNTVVVT